MKTFVITIFDIPESVQYAKRCAESLAPLEVSLFDAVTPHNTDVYKECKTREIVLGPSFGEEWSRKENAVACFLSHHSLWMKSVKENEELFILEHDAVKTGDLDFKFKYDKLISLGKPSYGRFTTPHRIGVNPLTSKQFLPGAHAYCIKPEGAKLLLAQAKINSKPTDVFLDLRTFNWLEELYPWPIEVQDTFSTIQKEKGCKAKHGYNDQYRLI